MKEREKIIVFKIGKKNLGNGDKSGGEGFKVGWIKKRMFLRREERRNDRKRIEKSLIERKRDNLKIGLKIMGLKIVEKRKKKRIKIDVERIMRMIKIGK